MNGQRWLVTVRLFQTEIDQAVALNAGVGSLLGAYIARAPVGATESVAPFSA